MKFSPQNRVIDWLILPAIIFLLSAPSSCYHEEVEGAAATGGRERRWGQTDEKWMSSSV